MKIGRHTIDVSNREKVFFPQTGITKGDVVEYYERLADVMLPHMRHYGTSMQRFPDGLQGEGFYHKDTPRYFPGWITTIKVPEREGGSFHAPVVDSKAALVYLADQAVLTFHLYLSRIDDLEYPDRMIYDLDPPEDSRDYGVVREAAIDIRSTLHELDLEAWVQTSGSKGFHLIVPLDRRSTFKEVHHFAYDTAGILVRRSERRYTLQQRKDKRKGRIFLDTLRNSYGATAVAPYALRARPGAPVATPLGWDEIKEGVSPRDWTLKNVPRRLLHRKDPWLGFMRHAYSIATRKKKLEKLLRQEKPAGEEEK